MVLQVIQDVAFHFRSLECSSCDLLLHLLMQRTFINQTCINCISRRDTIKDRGVGSLDSLASHRIFVAETEIKNAVLHGIFFCFVLFVLVCGFFFFVGLVMIIMRLFSFYGFSLVFSLTCVTNATMLQVCLVR